MEVWELNLLHDGDIERICMCSDEQPLFEMAVDRAFDLFAKINEWPLKQENCHASVSVNDKLHSILVKISTQDDNTVELWEYKWECIYKENGQAVTTVTPTTNVTKGSQKVENYIQSAQAQGKFEETDVGN